MDYAGLESIKKSYRDVLQGRGDYREAARLTVSKIEDPIFSGYSLHGNTEMNISEFNQALQKIGIDLVALDYQFSSAADLYSNLMEDISNELENIDTIIKEEKNRIQDLNIVLGNVSGFSSVKTFKVNDLIGEASGIDDYTFGAAVSSRNAVNISVSDISGNGYEGNKYVYSSNGVFQDELNDTGDRNKITDHSSLTYYEYSRITAPELPQYKPTDLNIDNIEAKCTLTITSPMIFNTLILKSEFKDIEIVQIAVSEDGIVYHDTLPNPIKINSEDMKYEDGNYVYGSGILSFPLTYYLKLTLQSNAITGETIGFKRVILEDIYVDRNYTFPTTAFLEEYLVPAVAYGKAYVDSTNNKPFSVNTAKGPNFNIGMILAVILAGTRGRPAMIGSYNFLKLPYESRYTFDSDTISQSSTILEDCTILEVSEKSYTVGTGSDTVINSTTTVIFTVSDQEEDMGYCAFDSRESGIDGMFRYIYTLLTPRIGSDTANFNDLDTAFIRTPTNVDIEKGTRYLCQSLYGSETTLSNLALQFYRQYNLSQYNTVQPTVITADIRKKYEQYFKRYDTHKTLGRTIDSAENVILLYKAHRHVIRINDLTCFSSVYNTESAVETGEIVTNPVDCVAIFASEYIPITFPAGTWVQYILTINGTEYVVVPINSNKAGIKIVRFSGYSIQENYTRHITEPIKSVNLKIKIRVPDIRQSPFVSNVKVCLGKPVVS